jgi:hypothetical protein
MILLQYQNLDAFFAAVPQKTGLSASIFWLRQKDFRYNAPEDGRFPIRNLLYGR